MTTLNATGNINYFLDTNLHATIANSYQTFEDLDGVVFVLGSCIFAVMTNDPSLEVASPGRASLTIDSGPQLGTASMEGQGFGSTSGVISRIEFDALAADEWDWALAFRLGWSGSTLPQLGPVTEMSLANVELGQQMNLKGSINIGSVGAPSGYITSITSVVGDLTLLLKGRIDIANTDDGLIRLVRLSDSEGGRVEFKGNYEIGDWGFLSDQPPGAEGILENLLQNEALFSGRDVMRVSSNAMAWNGLGGDDLMKGGSDGDTMRGGTGNDKLLGLAGDDQLAGDSGDDHLSGQIGDDILNGGEGKDVLTGGLGADDYLFDVIGSDHADVINGFRSQQGDQIVLDIGDFTSLAGGVLAINLISGANAVAQTEVQYLVFDSRSHQLYYDADGNGSGQAVLIATLAGVNNLTAADFDLVGA